MHFCHVTIWSRVLLPLCLNSLAHAEENETIACRQPPLTMDRRYCAARAVAKAGRAERSWAIDTDRLPEQPLLQAFPCPAHSQRVPVTSS